MCTQAPPEKLAIACEEFRTVEEMGIVRKATSQWASTAIVPSSKTVRQRHSWRRCGDYGRLNNAAVLDRYLVPYIQDLSTNLSGAKIFVKVDLVCGYHQIPVHQADVPKTAIITLFGLFEFLQMLFGLKECSISFPTPHGYSMPRS